MLEKIKTLLEINHNKSDKILTIMIEDTTQEVLNYCHIKKLPKGLESTVRSIIINKFKAENKDNISSIKRGDTQITYVDTNKGVYTPNEINTLNSYRKFRMR